MTEVVRFDVDGVSAVLVEVTDEDAGLTRVSRGEDGVLEASRRLIDALDSVRDAAAATLRVMSELGPDGLELEFGVKLAGEAGALIAKTSAEGHFQVKLVWAPRADRGGRGEGPA